MAERIIPEPVAEDDDDIVVALETARVSVERSDVESAVRWLQRAVTAARRQGRPDRAGALTRSIFKLGGPESNFERRKAEPHLLNEISEDDFSEQTIVESSFEIATDGGVDVALAKATPVAPLASQAKGAHHFGTRVAVKKALGGKLEVRPLVEGEPALSGEQEALLVPTRPGVKF